MKNVLIAIDQLVNTLVWAEGEGLGSPDETISARAWRLRDRNWRWASARKVIDTIFFWDKNHCQTSFESEAQRHQLPPEYQQL